MYFFNKESISLNKLKHIYIYIYIYKHILEHLLLVEKWKKRNLKGDGSLTREAGDQNLVTPEEEERKFF